MSKVLSTSPTNARLEFSSERWSRFYTDCSKQENALQPLSSLLKLHREITRSMRQVQSTFLDYSRPYVIGVAGSVSVGKSRFSKDLLTALGQGEERSAIQLVTTDSSIR